jgi:hypothetical protein
MVNVNTEREQVDSEAPNLSQAELGRRLGLSRAAVTRNKHLGMPVDSVPAAQAWREARQNVAQRKPLPQAPPQPDRSERGRCDPAADLPDEHRDAARTRREIADANIAEMEEARMRRELIRVSAVQSQLAVDFATTRDALLQIPARMGPLLAAEGDPAQVQNLLHAEIHQALVDLAGCADRVDKIEGAFD